MVKSPAYYSAVPLNNITTVFATSNSDIELLQFLPARRAGKDLCENTSQIRPKISDFGTFFNSAPAMLSNAAPDRPDTTHPRRAPHAQYTRQGQAGVRRTVRKVRIFLTFLGRGRSGLQLPLLIQNGTSWRGQANVFFSEISIKI